MKFLFASILYSLTVGYTLASSPSAAQTSSSHLQHSLVHHSQVGNGLTLALPSGKSLSSASPSSPLPISLTGHNGMSFPLNVVSITRPSSGGNQNANGNNKETSGLSAADEVDDEMKLAETNNYGTFSIGSYPPLDQSYRDGREGPEGPGAYAQQQASEGYSQGGEYSQGGKEYQPQANYAPPAYKPESGNKKTVILAIPVKLALQVPDKGQQGYAPQQQPYGGGQAYQSYVPPSAPAPYSPAPAPYPPQNQYNAAPPAYPPANNYPAANNYQTPAPQYAPPQYGGKPTEQYRQPDAYKPEQPYKQSGGYRGEQEYSGGQDGYRTGQQNYDDDAYGPAKKGGYNKAEKSEYDRPAAPKAPYGRGKAYRSPAGKQRGGNRDEDEYRGPSYDMTYDSYSGKGQEYDDEPYSGGQRGGYSGDKGNSYEDKESYSGGGGDKYGADKYGGGGDEKYGADKGYESDEKYDSDEQQDYKPSKGSKYAAASEEDEEEYTVHKDLASALKDDGPYGKYSSLLDSLELDDYKSAGSDLQSSLAANLKSSLSSLSGAGLAGLSPASKAALASLRTTPNVAAAQFRALSARQALAGLHGGAAAFGGLGAASSPLAYRQRLLAARGFPQAGSLARGIPGAGFAYKGFSSPFAGATSMAGLGGFPASGLSGVRPMRFAGSHPRPVSVLPR